MTPTRPTTTSSFWTLAIPFVMALALLVGCGDGDSSGGDATPPADTVEGSDTSPSDTMTGLDSVTGIDTAGDTMADDTAPGDTVEPLDVAADGTSVEDGMATDTAEGEVAGDDTAGEVDLVEWAEQYGEGCPSETRIGLFEAYIDRWGMSYVGGRVWSRVAAPLKLTEQASEGSCRLLQFVVPFCDPECALGTEECTDDGCLPFPEPLSVGDVTMTGLVTEVSMAPDATNFYDKYDFTEAAFEDGSPLELVATGGDLAGFSLQGTGVAPLEMVVTDYTWTDGDDLLIQWVPGDTPATIWIDINMLQHATGSPDIICEVPDTGEFVVTNSLMTELMSYGVAGAATLWIRRHTLDSVTLDEGCIELEVWTEGEAYLQVD